MYTIEDAIRKHNNFYVWNGRLDKDYTIDHDILFIEGINDYFKNLKPGSWFDYGWYNVEPSGEKQYEDTTFLKIKPQTLSNGVVINAITLDGEVYHIEDDTVGQQWDYNLEG